MRYVVELVERIPHQLREGVVYHNEEFELAALLCACGCGHRITLLVPDSHQVTSKGGLATIHPSIGVWDAECKSHYFITAGQVEWLAPFTGAQASSLMQKQIARHAALEIKQLTMLGRLHAALRRTWEVIRSVFWTKR